MFLTYLPLSHFFAPSIQQTKHIWNPRTNFSEYFWIRIRPNILKLGDDWTPTMRHTVNRSCPKMFLLSCWIFDDARHVWILGFQRCQRIHEIGLFSAHKMCLLHPIIYIYAQNSLGKNAFVYFKQIIYICVCAVWYRLYKYVCIIKMI